MESLRHFPWKLGISKEVTVAENLLEEKFAEVTGLVIKYLMCFPIIWGVKKDFLNTFTGLLKEFLVERSWNFRNFPNYFLTEAVKPLI